MKTLKSVKKSDLFRLKETENGPVWVKGEYIRSEKACEWTVITIHYLEKKK